MESAGGCYLESDARPIRQSLRTFQFSTGGQWGREMGGRKKKMNCLPLSYDFPILLFAKLSLWLGFPGGTSGKEPTHRWVLLCRRHRRHGLDPWVGKIPLEEEMATVLSILAWRIPWTEEPGGLQSIGSQRVRHNWSNLASLYKPLDILSPNTPAQHTLSSVFHIL